MGTLSIRWMIRRDMPDVLEIESQHRYGWDEESLLTALRQRNCIGMVCEDAADNIVGWMVYELHQDKLVLLHVAVDLECRRAYVGTAMMDKLKQKLSAQRRHEIWCDCTDDNLTAHLFFRDCGFRCERVIRGNYDDPDMYRFVAMAESEVLA